MPEAIKSGFILVKEDTQFPDGFQLESAAYSPGWRSVKGMDGYALERKIHDAGWTFFYLAGESRVSVFGREGQETVRRVIKRILAGLTSEKCNALEVTRIVSKHFLGMPYSTVSFHKRNVQEGMFLAGGDDSRVWKDERLAAA